MRGKRGKAREWLARYGLAELFGTFGSYAGFWMVAAFAGSLAASSYGAAFGENIGFYGYVLVRELTARRNRSLCSIGRDMALEFGAAELLDFFIVRPGATYIAVDAIGETAGILVGKVSADIVFYALAISYYERAKARRQGE